MCSCGPLLFVTQVLVGIQLSRNWRFIPCLKAHINAISCMKTVGITGIQFNVCNSPQIQRPLKRTWRALSSNNTITGTFKMSIITGSTFNWKSGFLLENKDDLPKLLQSPGNVWRVFSLIACLLSSIVYLLIVATMTFKISNILCFWRSPDLLF